MAKTVLIIDDSDSMRQVVNIVLGGVGYEVIEACDGPEALLMLDGRKVHLIICDVSMPRMDGITLVKNIRQLPAYKFTPIVMLTTETRKDKKLEGKAAGVKAWLVKPFDYDKLLEVVSKLILV